MLNTVLRLIPRLRWKIAQKGEAQWWTAWFKEHENDDAWLNKLLEYFDLKENQDFGEKTLVDIGSGPIGVLTKLKAKEKIAVDPLPIESIDKTIKRIMAIGEKIPLPDEEADCVFIYNVLQHVISPEKVLKEGTRILKKGGAFYIAEKLNVPADRLHPHSLKLGMFEKWISDNAFEIIKKMKMEDHSLASPSPGSGYAALCLILRKKR